MKKTEVAKAISDDSGLDLMTSQIALDSFFKVTKKSMVAGRNIYFRGFGTFFLKPRARKVARNISKQEPIIIEAHIAPAFRPSPGFVNRVKKANPVA